MNEDKPVRVMRWLADLLLDECGDLLAHAVKEGCTCINQCGLEEDVKPLSIIELEASIRQGDTWIAAERIDNGTYMGIGVHRKVSAPGTWQVWIPPGVEGEERATIQRNMIRLLNMVK